MQTMSKIIKTDLPVWTGYNKIKALVSNISMTRNSLKAVGAKQKLFVSCFTVDTITNKLEDSMQYKFFIIR